MPKSIKLVWISLIMLLLFLPKGVYAAEVEEKIITQVEPQMTLEQVSEVNQIPLDVLLQNIGSGEFKADQTVQDIMGETGIDLDKIKSKVRGLQVETSEEGRKDWFKIKLKFILWALVIISGMVLLKNATGKYHLHRIRNFLIGAAVLIFGFWLGSDPNPVGTIKDAFVLYGQEGIIFKPRLVAMTAFLLTVALGGRMLCGWGCQLGTLQEVIYQIPLPKIRLSFKFTQIFRIIFFFAMTLLALGWGFDLLGPYDPFKIFQLKPLVYLGSTIVAALILFMSLFIYRPWCQILCPFGLVAWLVEKISWFSIRVNKNLCVNCGVCHQVCPTGAIAAKHHGKSEIDCYNCSVCIDKCPTKAISYCRNTSYPKQINCATKSS